MYLLADQLSTIYRRAVTYVLSCELYLFVLHLTALSISPTTEHRKLG